MEKLVVLVSIFDEYSFSCKARQHSLSDRVKR